MARQERKKARLHGVAAHSKASSSRDKVQKTNDISLSAAAVAATFGDEPEEDAAPASNATDEDGEPVTADMQSLSRGQRKRLKRHTAFMRKMGMVSRITQERHGLVKTPASDAFAGLETMQSSLFQAVEDKEKSKSWRDRKKKALSGRQRQKLAVRELSQLKAVQTHTGFKSDPFAAIQAHLQNTVVQANQALLQKTNAAMKKRVKGTTSMDVEA